jgi:sugar phosphate isomerase/epimerase
MLLTLSTRSFAKTVASDADGSISMLDLPAYAVTHLNLRGLNVAAEMLAGWSLEDLDALRDHADKAACPCLVLVEETPLAISGDDQAVEAAIERIKRLAAAGNRLGCNALSIRFDATDTDENFERIFANMRLVMPAIERNELNILIAPHEGLTHQPDRLVELLKRIGGFRIGCLPTFAHAAMFDDPRDVLRKLAPYAGAIHATVAGFTKAGKHTGLDLAAGVDAIRSVGFVNTLAIEYIGKDDPATHVEQARVILAQAIEVEES